MVLNHCNVHKFNYSAAAAAATAMLRFSRSNVCMHKSCSSRRGYLGDTKQILDSTKSNDQMPSYG